MAPDPHCLRMHGNLQNGGSKCVPRMSSVTWRGVVWRQYTYRYTASKELETGNEATGIFSGGGKMMCVEYEYAPQGIFML